MKIQCDYCSNTYEDTLEQCPFCGAPNPSHKNDGKPKTIEELRDWYVKRNLPPEETTRFFIGKNYEGPKAFGIYRDASTGDFIVYKNKADGSRAVRYQGKDEQYAVNELYQRLKDEIVNQRSHQGSGGMTRGGAGAGGSRGRSSAVLSGFARIRRIVIAVFVVLAIMSFVLSFLPSNNGYYSYGNDTWYRYNDNWYYYDTLYNDWYDADDYDYTVPEQLYEADRESDYYEGSSWDSSMDVTDWDDTEYYTETHSSDSDSDSGYDWSSDSSWDSGGSDWSSDW